MRLDLCIIVGFEGQPAIEKGAVVCYDEKINR